MAGDCGVDAFGSQAGIFTLTKVAHVPLRPSKSGNVFDLIVNALDKVKRDIPVLVAE